MKHPVVSLPDSRRSARLRQLHGAVTRFQTWQRSFQTPVPVRAATRRPGPAPAVRPRG